MMDSYTLTVLCTVSRFGTRSQLTRYALGVPPFSSFSATGKVDLAVELRFVVSTVCVCIDPSMIRERDGRTESRRPRFILARRPRRTTPQPGPSCRCHSFLPVVSPKSHRIQRTLTQQWKDISGSRYSYIVHLSASTIYCAATRDLQRPSRPSETGPFRSSHKHDLQIQCTRRPPYEGPSMSST